MWMKVSGEEGGRIFAIFFNIIMGERINALPKNTWRSSYLMESVSSLASLRRCSQKVKTQPPCWVIDPPFVYSAKVQQLSTALMVAMEP